LKVQDKELLHSCILLERAPYGDLNELLRKGIFVNDMKLIRTYFAQLIDGLEYLHSKDVAHLDISPHNVLVGKSYQVEIADFKNSEVLSCQKTSFKGRKNYRPPELNSGTCEDLAAVDIYAAGVLLFRMRYDVLPINEDSARPD